MEKWLLKLEKPGTSKQSQQTESTLVRSRGICTARTSTEGLDSNSTSSNLTEDKECHNQLQIVSHDDSRIEEEPTEEFDEDFLISDTSSLLIQQSFTSDDSTKTKPAKKKKTITRSHKFNQKWLEIEHFQFWLTMSPKNRKDDPIEYALCKVCNINIFPNKADLLRHTKTEKHINLTKVVSQTQSLEHMVNPPHFVNVRFAELKLAGAIAECNLPFSFMDTLSPLCGQIFSASKIAKDFARKRTKTTSIIKETLGKQFQEELFSVLRRQGDFFSLIMDQTTVVGAIKQCGFAVIFFSKTENKVVTRFFDLVEVVLGDANALYECLKKCLEVKKIPLRNLVGFASDTTNVMVGNFNYVFSHLRSELPEIALIKCSCHMIHLCASKACLELPRRVEDVLRNIEAHFSRSFSRQNKFKEFQLFFDIEIRKILLPSQTRWLSLEQCCSRILEQYTPLTEYFGYCALRTLQ